MVEAFHDGIDMGIRQDFAGFFGIRGQKIAHYDHIALAALAWGNIDGDLALMAFLAEFAVKDDIGIALPEYCFAHDDLRLALAGRNAIFAAHALHDDVKMQFAHAGKHAHPRILVRAGAQGGIFLKIAGKGIVKDLALVRIARLKGNGDYGRPGINRLKPDVPVRRAICLPSFGIAQSNYRGNIAGANFIQLFTAVCKQARDAAHAVNLAGRGIFQALAFPDCAGIKPDKGQLAAVFHDDLENQGDRIGCGIIRNYLAAAALKFPERRPGIGGGWQKGADSVQQGLNARIAQGRAAIDGRKLAAKRGAAKRVLDVSGSLAAFQPFFQENVIGFGQFFQKLFAPGRGNFIFFWSEGRFCNCLALVSWVKNKLHAR